MRHRFSPDDVKRILQADPSQLINIPHVIFTDVVIAGSGPIACAYARTILEKNTTVEVTMVEIGSQDSPIVGAHHKNSIKYQKDVDAFVNVIKGALQPVSEPPADTHISTMGGDGWRPKEGDVLIFQGRNPAQNPNVNLKACAVTRGVGGMATHWTCACPTPDAKERENNPIPKDELDELLERSRILFNVRLHEYDESIRHIYIQDILQKQFPDRKVQNLPLAVERRKDNPAYVTWTGANTVLGNAVNDKRFTLLSETRVSKVLRRENLGRVDAVMVRDLKNDADCIIFCKVAVVACGAVGTPQVLAASGIYPEALGKYLSEQSIAFCQVVLKEEAVDAIESDPSPEIKKKVEAHHEKYPTDPLPIPFDEPEPQVMIPFTAENPWHCQVHRDAFSYGDVGPRADSRIVIDLRWFGRQEVKKENRLYFVGEFGPYGWNPGVTDIYGMPQATFEVVRSATDHKNDQNMMRDMCNVASYLGAYLPGSNPQFMEPGLALHMTGTTRIGKYNPSKPADKQDSVADENSKVHGFENLYVGGNGCIPDSTGSNPTLTSVAIAIKSAEHIAAKLKSKEH